MQEEKHIPPPGLRRRWARTKILKVLKGFNIMPHETLRSRYDSRYVANRMARAIGHVRLVKSMVEQGADCTDVLIQLAAVRSALSSTAKIILKDHIEHCVSGANSGDNESLSALNDAIDKFI